MAFRIVIIVALFAGVVCPWVVAAEQPNILFIMTDDQGPWAWGDGHPDAMTPHIDRLRSGGVLLENYFVTSPVCSPARASLLTSRYPTELGITDWIPPDIEPALGVDAQLATWPRAFQQAGYRTGLIGKWHLGREDKHLPQRFGYDYFAGFRHGGMVSLDPLVELDGVERVVKGYTPDVLTDLALDFLSTKSKQPFLLSLHFWAPHANANKTVDGDRTWMPLSEADWAPFKELTPTFPKPVHPDLDVPRATRMTREYLASVHSVDRNVGRLLALLDKRGLSENTIVVFTSDHGYNMVHHGIWHKGNGRWLLKGNQGARPNLWDTSLRAPAIIRWPMGIEAGTTITKTTTCLDWFPSLLSMAKVPQPENAILRGQDMAPLLAGKTVPWRDTVLVQMDQQYSSPKAANLRGYRTPEWKLVRDFRNPGREELYDLKHDPGELRNVYESKKLKVRDARLRLEKEMRAAMEELGDVEVFAGE